MWVINKPGGMVKRQYVREEPVARAVRKFRTFMASTPDYDVNSALKMQLLKDAEFRRWQKQEQQTTAKKGSSNGPKPLAKP